MTDNTEDYKQILLTKEEALSLLDDWDIIHTYTNPGGMLIWTDWDRKDIETAMDDSVGMEIWWQSCKWMWHWLVIWKTERDPLFVQANSKKIEAMEKEKKD